MIVANGNCTVKLKDSTGNGTIFSDGTVGTAVNGATLQIESGNYVSNRDTGFWAGGKNRTGHIIVNGGTITAQEFAIAVGKDSSLVVNGGDFETIDNAVFGANGSAGYENVSITINGGKMDGHIQTAGYTGCGVYMPTSGKVEINDGSFTIDGVGICARAGEVEINGGNFVSTVNTSGWVGDKKTQISANGVYYDGAAKYPYLDASAKITIKGGTFTNTADAAIAGVKITQPDNGIEVQSDITGWTVEE